MFIHLSCLCIAFNAPKVGNLIINFNRLRLLAFRLFEPPFNCIDVNLRAAAATAAARVFLGLFRLEQVDHVRLWYVAVAGAVLYSHQVVVVCKVYRFSTI